jgi:hypothetical protein
VLALAGRKMMPTEFDDALAEIRTIVDQELPSGHHIESVNLTVDALVERQVPVFTVDVTTLEDEDADEGMGVGHAITQRIRQRWSRDDLYIRLHWKVSSVP